ncbi:MAG: TetR/AcrR family transcriptional regulator [Tannerellaceae bacterium]|nr:TetR/AcrR family transcriptional regulator [Tannerellaceae bacterium]
MDNKSRKIQQKRFRRTKTQLEFDLEQAISKVIQRNGFHNATVTDIVKKAQCEPGVFYKRYDSLEKVLFLTTLRLPEVYYELLQRDKAAQPEINLLNTLDEICDYLSKDSLFKRLIQWEIAEKNKSTSRSFKEREHIFSELTDLLSNNDYKYAYAIILGGIYYLSISKQYSTCMGVDFKSKENWKKIKVIYKNMLQSLDNPLEEEEQINITKYLLAQGFNYTKIKRATGLTISDIMKIDIQEDTSN